MSTNRNLETPAGISPADIYFVIFRHKWKIILLSLAGIVAAVALYFHNQPPYQSQAELLIKYVSQARSLSLSGSDQSVIMPGSSGEDIINSEILILTSLDLAEQAVTNFGAAKILPNSGGDSNVIAAAVFIRNNLVAEPAGKGSSVISVTLKHPDPLIVQPLLTEVINDYFQKHKEIHSAGGQFDDVLTAERADLGNQLNDTEQRLASLKSKANIISLDDSKRGLAEQMSKVQGAILDAQADLAGYEAAAKQMGNGPAQKQETTNAPTSVPRDQIDAYNDVCTRLDLLRKKQQDYLVQGYTAGNVVVRELGRQIAATQTTKSGLEEKYPQIAGLGAASSAPGGPSPSPVGTQAGIAALQARLQALDAQLDKLQLQATNLNSLAPAIANLEQTRSIQQANYQNLATKLENSHIDEALDTGKTPNIKWVQTASPPFRDWKKTYKTVAMVAFGGLIAGLAWAFLIEFYLDRSIKRPVDLSAKLRIPFFLSIPDLNHNRRSRLAATERRQLENGDPKSLATTANGDLEIASPLVNHALHSHYDALRDRLVNYFDSINLTRKPKLVAVTSTARRAGVSTIAAGLAASLSETGDGRVLLVDMNLKSGAAQQFVNGKPGCQLDDALISDKRENALVQENLYVVSEASNASNLPRILPKRFASLVPKLKSSDYDYIIFDMPPVTQTSVTTRLAGFMDMVMLVIESEKTDREAVQQANQLLLQSKSNVTAVLNKTRKYVPARLQHDLDADV
jgi:uncharacterized protein involved in exopolysaccharide biosynthesis/Mrp family chromosome partitioning ATPase